MHRHIQGGTSAHRRPEAASQAVEANALDLLLVQKSWLRSGLDKVGLIPLNVPSHQSGKSPPRKLGSYERGILERHRMDKSLIVNFHIAAAFLVALLITLNSFIIYNLYRFLLAEYSPKKTLCIMLALVAIIVTPVYLPFFNNNL